MDPPVNCVVFCQDVDELAFTPQCFGPAAGERFLQFQASMEANWAELEAQGVQVCPAADKTRWLTPCDAGIIPVEHPDQDHAVCEPVPPGCPLLP